MGIVGSASSGPIESGIQLGQSGNRVLVFLPGFIAPASAYRELLEPVASNDFCVVVPQLYRPTPSVLSGRFTVEEEAARAVDLIDSLQATGVKVFVGGHSRGGQSAWRAARMLQQSGSPIAGLVLVDPVDGSGPWPTNNLATLNEVEFSCPTLIVGAGRGGKCAPADRNHELFAASTVGAQHVVLEDLAHADVMSGAFGWAGRWLCGSGPMEGSPARREVSQLIIAHVDACDQHPGPG